MKTIANVLDQCRADGWSREDRSELLGAVLNEPEVCDSVTAALEQTNHFQRTRGAMLRALRAPAQLVRSVQPILRIVK